MKNVRKSASVALALTSAAAIGFTTVAANAASISIVDYSLAPDGQNLATTFQHTNVNTLNGSTNVLPTTNGTVVYVLSTFVFGASSDAHLQWRFSTSSTTANRIGIEVQDTGLVQTLGTNDGILQAISSTTPKRTSVNLNADMAGQTITLLAKLYYNSNVHTDLDTRQSFNGTQSTADDTIMNIWINPDGSDVEGNTSSHAAMLGNGDMYAVWNSASFTYFRQTIQNQLTPIGAGTSSIINTTILTGDDATFANALALAMPIPEPASFALLGMGGLLIAGRRRHA